MTGMVDPLNERLAALEGSLSPAAPGIIRTQPIDARLAALKASTTFTPVAQWGNPIDSDLAVIAAATGGGTLPSNYYFAATRLRWPIALGTVQAGNPYNCNQFVVGTPDYDVVNPRFFLPTFWAQPNLDTPSPSAFTVQGISIKVGGVWYESADTNLNCDPAVEPVGYLTAAIPVTLTRNTTYTCRIAFQGTSGQQIPVCDGRLQSGVLEFNMFSASDLSAKLTDGSALTNSGGSMSNMYLPAFMIAQGGDGRPVWHVIGDSIGYGKSETIGTNDARGNLGFLGRGFDDIATSKRMAYHLNCIPGGAPSAWNTQSNWAKRIAAVSAVAAGGKCPNTPFTHMICEHGNNSMTSVYSDFQTIMTTFWGLCKTLWPGYPLYQTEMIAHPSSTDGFQTLGNQVQSAADAYTGSYATDGSRWKFNYDIGKLSATGDATALYVANGTLAGSFSPWPGDSYDSAANKGAVRIIAFSTTLAADYAANALSCSLTAAPAVGDNIIFNPNGTGQFSAGVLGVSGSGPYTVTLNGGGAGETAGTIVTATVHDVLGTHPSQNAHIQMAGNTIAFKNAYWPPSIGSVSSPTFYLLGF